MRTTIGIVLLLAACASPRAREPRPGPTETAAAPAPMGMMGGGMGGMRGMGGMQAAMAQQIRQPTAAMLALGDSIFHGKAAGGTCLTCHGADARGTALAPDLTDATWLNGDGSPIFIMHTIMHGIASPKQYPAPMPAMGGVQLTHPQGQAVAAYVYALSRRR